MTAEEKIEELDCLIEHKEKLIYDLQNELKSSIKPENLKEKVESIVQKEVEQRVKLI